MICHNQNRGTGASWVLCWRGLGSVVLEVAGVSS